MNTKNRPDITLSNGRVVVHSLMANGATDARMGDGGSMSLAESKECEAIRARETIQQTLDNPAASYWLKSALTGALALDDPSVRYESRILRDVLRDRMNVALKTRGVMYDLGEDAFALFRIINGLLANDSLSPWFHASLIAARDRDSVDAADDANLLVMLLEVDYHGRMAQQDITLSHLGNGGQKLLT